MGEETTWQCCECPSVVESGDGCFPPGWLVIEDHAVMGVCCSVVCAQRYLSGLSPVHQQLIAKLLEYTRHTTLCEAVSGVINCPECWTWSSAVNHKHECDCGLDATAAAIRRVNEPATRCGAVDPVAPDSTS